jgi:hypothetical protein
MYFCLQLCVYVDLSEGMHVCENEGTRGIGVSDPLELTGGCEHPGCMLGPAQPPLQLLTASCVLVFILWDWVLCLSICLHQVPVWFSRKPKTALDSLEHELHMVVGAENST